MPVPDFSMGYVSQDDAAAILLAGGAEVNAKSRRGWTPLHEAFASGRTALVEMLLANKADINAKDNLGLTPLDVAAANSRK